MMDDQVMDFNCESQMEPAGLNEVCHYIAGVGRRRQGRLLLP